MRDKITLEYNISQKCQFTSKLQTNVVCIPQKETALTFTNLFNFLIVFHGGKIFDKKLVSQHQNSKTISY